MTCLDIFETVAALTGEDSADSGAEPMKRRVPALINTAAIELWEVDCAYRRFVNGEIVDDSDGPDKVHSLDDECPVCTRLVPALCFYVAALLIRDENSALAEMLSQDFANSRDAVARMIPASRGSIADRYQGF